MADGTTDITFRFTTDNRIILLTAFRLYLGIGEADTVQSIEMHQRFLDAVEALDHVEVRTFPGADHGYTWPGYPTYDETAAETSWDVTLTMLADAFAD